MKRSLYLFILVSLIGCQKAPAPPTASQSKPQEDNGAITISAPFDPTVPVTVVPSTSPPIVQAQQTVVGADGKPRTVTVDVPVFDSPTKRLPKDGLTKQPVRP